LEKKVRVPGAIRTNLFLFVLYLWLGVKLTELRSSVAKLKRQYN